MGKASREKRERKSEAPTKEWEFQERVVELLERSLTPDARVRTDKNLPSLKTGHIERFDVVIERGTPPRETLTVVEVQKRGRKVEIGDFRNWLLKRDEVGAQHLICVSEAGFPDSVVDLAKMEGQSVRLLTLSELKGETWPVRLVGKELRVVEVRYELLELKPFRPGVIQFPETYEIGKQEATFAMTGKHGLLSGMDLAKLAVDSQPGFQFKPPGSYDVGMRYIPPPGVEISLVRDGRPRTLSALDFTLKVHVERFRLPLTCSGYEQVNFKGALAYAITGSGDVGGKVVRASLIFLPEKSGLLRFADFVFDGIPPDDVRMTFSRFDPWLRS
jgi:hypothetical protein